MPQSASATGAFAAVPADTYDPPVNLVDPITSKRLKLGSPFSDKLLRLNGRQKFKLGLRNMFVDLPQAVWQGLKGDSRFTFSDFLNVARIPYYLGGAFLAASFAAGRARVDFIRQAVGVVLYYAGVTLTNKLVNFAYKEKYGIDPDLRYRKFNGDIERVYGSLDFPRFDLLSETDYHRLARKMNIPENIADPKREIHDQTKRLIMTSLADKLVLGNVLAAVGAGYIARSNAWARLLDQGPNIRDILFGKGMGTLRDRIVYLGLALRGILGPGVREKITGYAGESRPWLRRGILLSVAALVATTAAHILLAGRRDRKYESPLINSLSPELAMGSPTWEPVRKDLASTKVSLFSLFEQNRADATMAPGGARR